MSKHILVVDDDLLQLTRISNILQGIGYEVTVAESGEYALQLLYGAKKKKNIQLVLLDMIMPEMSGMEVLRTINSKSPGLPVIVLTANASVSSVIDAMKEGARDFIIKPANPERLKVSINNSIQISTLTTEISRLSHKGNNCLQFDQLIAKSPVMKKVIRMAKRASKSNIPVLIEGESGVGKEVLARCIQGSSPRACKPFVAVNCGAIPANLVESVLFGHEKGSFTGAIEKQQGKFHEADGGTIFLDEIGEMPLPSQVKLLRAIQEGEIDTVGKATPDKVDVRIISATNRDLMEMVKENIFREDLYYRLNVFPIVLHPLCQRSEDIKEFITYFINKFSASENKYIVGISPEAENLLLHYEWPGNIRQLENTIYRAVVLCDNNILSVNDFPQISPLVSQDRNYNSLNTSYDNINIKEESEYSHLFYCKEIENLLSPFDTSGQLRPLAEIEKDMISITLTKYNRCISKSANSLGIGRSTLYRKMREFNIA